jgi:hypothetical protein
MLYNRLYVSRDTSTPLHKRYPGGRKCIVLCKIVPGGGTKSIGYGRICKEAFPPPVLLELLELLVPLNPEIPSLVSTLMIYITPGLQSFVKCGTLNVVVPFPSP